LRERQALEDDHASRSWRLDGDRDALRHSETVYNRSWASYESDLATFRADLQLFIGPGRPCQMPRE
jgi:hypothetical protein